MSDKKKLDEILEILKALEERIKELENRAARDSERQNPYPYINRRKCPNCNGTGKIDDYHPWRDKYFIG